MNHLDEQLHIARMAALLENRLSIPPNGIWTPKMSLPERLRSRPLVQQENLDEQ